jgi:uncharacterized membrane protein YqiK
MDFFTWVAVAVLILCAVLIFLILWLGAPNRVSRTELRQIELRRTRRRRRRRTHKLSA